MLHQLFGSLQEEPNLLEDGRLDYGVLPIGRLLTLVGLEPKLIKGFSLPTSWKQLHNLYRELGLVATERWQLCIVSTQAPHDPHLMSPSVEDLYEGFEVVRYECGLNSRQKFKKDCPGCFHRCLICLQMKKCILAYDYMPIGPLLASLCKSRSICEKILMTWRAKDRWLGKDPKVLPEVIKEHFDGNKFPKCQAFWNPKREWEALVICPNNKCSHFFQTFLPAQKCEELFQHWDSNTNYYKFPCSECSIIINVKAYVESKSRTFLLAKFF
jgi:hypothetical protein